jgi:hypothetical protein
MRIPIPDTTIPIVLADTGCNDLNRRTLILEKESVCGPVGSARS